MYGLRAGRGQISFTAEAQGRKGTLRKVLVSLGASAVKTNDGASCEAEWATGFVESHVPSINRVADLYLFPETGIYNEMIHVSDAPHLSSLAPPSPHDPLTNHDSRGPFQAQSLLNRTSL
jgi:hypothetical protein